MSFVFIIFIRVLFVACMVFIIGTIFGSFGKRPVLKTLSRIAAILVIVLFIAMNGLFMRAAAGGHWHGPWRGDGHTGPWHHAWKHHGQDCPFEGRGGLPDEGDVPQGDSAVLNRLPFRNEVGNEPLAGGGPLVRDEPATKER